MAHKFNPKNLAKLDSPIRRELLPPFQVLKSIGLTTGVTMLDLGCGTGFFTFPASELIGNQGRVYAVDISAELLDEAQKRWEQFLNQNDSTLLAPVEFLQSQENNIPVLDSSIDLILMANVFHELESPQELLQEVKRILRANGRIALIEWKKEEMEWGPPLKERLEPSEVEVALKESGFTDIKILELEPAHYAVIGER